MTPLGIEPMTFPLVAQCSYKMYWADETRYDPDAVILSRNLFET
jgi:hypothetical protein